MTKKLFKSSAFEGFKKYREFEASQQNAIIDRLNVLIKAQNNIIKSLGR